MIFKRTKVSAFDRELWFAREPRNSFVETSGSNSLKVFLSFRHIIISCHFNTESWQNCYHILEILQRILSFECNDFTFYHFEKYSLVGFNSSVDRASDFLCRGREFESWPGMNLFYFYKPYRLPKCTFGAISGWNATLQSRVGMLNSWTTFLLYYVVSCSSQRWHQTCT